MKPHHSDAPSEWVVRWSALVPAAARVLDVAGGRGRHARWLSGRGHPVDVVDRDAEALASLAHVPGVSTHCADIERGEWPFSQAIYGAVVVTNYLHRPLFPQLLASLAPAGVLIYETFAAGNERFGRPSNPDFLLKSEELLDVVRGRLRVVAYEDVKVPAPALVQRICAVADNGSPLR